MTKINKHLKVRGELKDRGLIKWQGMMLTEHVQLLREWAEENKQDKKPDLDEFDMQLIQEELELALKRKCEVYLQSWRQGEFHYHRGIVVDIDVQSRTIKYEDPFGIHRLPVDELTFIRSLN